MKRILAATVIAGVAALAPWTATAAPAAGEGGHDKGAALKKADANNDGQITFEELSAVRPGVTREQFNKRDRNGDGVLSKADRAQDKAPAAKEAAKPKGERSEPFRKADTNHDGNVTFEEATAANPKFDRARFDKLDRNKDGVLNRQDLAEAKGDAAQGPKGDARGDAAQKLKQADANGDGQVTYEEVTAKKPGFPRESFDRLDRNKDGVISQADRAGQQQMAQAQGQGKPNMRERLQAADTNSDGKVSPDEAKAAFPKMTPETFKRLDRNGDGFLSPEDKKQGA